MRTSRTIVKQINRWKDNPMMVSGIYRLFVYLDWEAIPKRFKDHFPEDAKEKWEKDAKEDFTVESISVDIKAEILAFMKVLAEKNIIHCLGLMPMIIADMYVCNKPVNKIQSKLIKAINTYKEFIDVDRPLAEQYTAITAIELMEEVIKIMDLELTFDFEGASKNILKQFNTKSTITPELQKDVDKALKEAEEAERKAEKESA